MTFKELKIELSSCSKLSFPDASQSMQDKIFALDKADILDLVLQIGAIPEDIAHDSSEEKLYTKVSDILLAKSLMELDMEAAVLTQRADCADVIAQSRYHNYSLVGDAKAFRLSRTARNAKDYKVTSMDKWRGDCDYSVLVCPYFQYPKNKSQIYKDALDGNVSLFSWEYIYILLKEGIKESPDVNLSQLWNQSEVIGKNTTVANAKHSFLHTQNINIAESIGVEASKFGKYFDYARAVLAERGIAEIEYYRQEIARVKRLNREEAITELLKSMKLDNKIETIQSFLNQINAQTDE